MSIANEVDEIIQKRNSRVEKLNMREEHIKDVFTALEKLQEQKKRVLDNSDKLRLEKDVLECIEQLDIQPYLRMWEKLQREFENLRKRFSRDSINIAVIGEARQGKSRLLQTISGLDDKVIPAFTTTDCTGATSTIKNVKELISMLEPLENKGLANMDKNKSPAPIAYLCGFPEARHARKSKLRLSISGEARNAPKP